LVSLVGDPVVALAATGLLGLRLWALLRQQVLWREICGPVWEVCAVGLALVIALGFGMPTELAYTMDVDITGWLLLALFEILFGTVVGALASLPGHAVLGALDASGTALGAPTATGWRLLGCSITGLCGVSLGVHRPLVAALIDLQFCWPVGHPEWWLSGGGFAGDVISNAHHALLLSLALATPVLLCAAVFDLSQRLLTRGAGPWMFALETLRPWLMWATALIALAASWAAYPGAWARGLG